MKTVNYIKFSNQLIRLIIPAILICSLSGTTYAQLPPGGTNGPSYTPLDTWSFYDVIDWTSDDGYAPVSFTNLNYSDLGYGGSLVVDSTNASWLQYNVMETNGATNLTLNAGTVAFWFAPNWSSTNVGGLGPQELGRLLEAGAYTPDSSYGWWSIYVDAGGNNLYFSAQTNDLSSNVTTYVSAPISWTTNYFHYVVVTYCSTNTSLYLDGGLTATGPPLTVYPGTNVLANGFFIGSDSNGVWPAHGLFSDVETYCVPMDAGTIQSIFHWDFQMFMMDPQNAEYMSNLKSSTNSTPAVIPTFNAVAGQGNLITIGPASSCVTSSNVWITNIVAAVASDGTTTVTFTIEGGSNGVPYDVFANSLLSFGQNGVPWAWMGQGYQCTTYMLTGLPNTTCFLILGTPQDSDGDGLTDAYEQLVSKTNPHVANTSGDGLLDGWDVLWGLNPLINNWAQSGQRSNYSYNTVDWLGGVSGIRTGSINLDNEGNVLSVSQ